MPVRPMSAFVITGNGCRPGDRIAVGQQDRTAAWISIDGYIKNRQNIRSIQKPGDLAKTFGFTLSAIDATRAIQPLQCRIGIWIDDADCRHNTM